MWRLYVARLCQMGQGRKVLEYLKDLDVNAGESDSHLLVYKALTLALLKQTSEAEQIVTAVRESGREAWYMLALDEGHGFRKKTNRDAMGYALALFWETYLLQE